MDLFEEPHIHVTDQGAGPCVVLLHGMPSSPSDYDSLAHELAARHRVLVPHLPGYGASPPSALSGSIDATIAALERRLLDLDVEEADIVAFSGGAYKAVAMALRGHVHVKRLVLFAPLVGLDAGGARAYRDVAAATLAGAFDPRRTWLERMCSVGTGHPDPATAARVFGWLDAVPASVICSELVAMADAADLRPRLPRLRCPVWICAGTADNAVPFAQSEEIARVVPGARLERVEGRGHALLLEMPALASRFVQAALESALGER